MALIVLQQLTRDQLDPPQFLKDAMRAARQLRKARFEAFGAAGPRLHAVDREHFVQHCRRTVR